MKHGLIRLAKNLAKRFDIGLARYSRLESLREYENDVNAFLSLPEERRVRLMSLVDRSTSQLRQDLFVLNELNFKREGFFVEFGATDGVELSNTFLLEKHFNWSGILAEPARGWHDDLHRNRECVIETNCVWKDSSSELTFVEHESREFSGIDGFADSASAEQAHGGQNSYQVKTISLNDLLSKYHAPEVIDYLSIDTEGSEYEILKSFDFSKHRFRVITCEHNFSRRRELVFNLLMRHGYQRRHVGFSKWEDWYVGA